MFKNAQSGRSMVEMLGVLAIIGVLSIGGIAGYTLSMRRYRANQILDLANKYAVILYNGCQKAFLDGRVESLDLCAHTENKGLIHYAETDLGGVDITGGQSADIISTSSEDAVVVPIAFQDQAVCKAAQSIAGVKGTTICELGLGVEAYTLDAKFKFN